MRAVAWLRGTNHMAHRIKTYAPGETIPEKVRYKRQWFRFSDAKFNPVIGRVVARFDRDV